MIDGGMRHMRQEGLVNSDIFATPVCVVGAGGIGSFTTLALAKIGFQDISVWDMDMIEEHNISNQFYPLSNVGVSKVDGLAQMISMFEGISIRGYKKRWNKEEKLQGVVVAAVDNMKTRLELFQAVKKDKNVLCLIDGRMGGNQLEVYTVFMQNKTDIRPYTRTLLSDEQIPDVPCTQKAVMYNVLNIASWITNQIRLVLSGKEYKRQLIMDLETMMLVIPEERVRRGR